MLRRPNVAHKNRKLGWLSCFSNCESFVFKSTISSGKCFLSMLYFGLQSTSLEIRENNFFDTAIQIKIQKVWNTQLLCIHCKYIQFLIVSTFHCNLAVRFTFFAIYSPMYKLHLKNCKSVYNYSTVLGAAIKCKPYSEITVESRTHFKTVKITSNIFAVWLYQRVG